MPPFKGEPIDCTMSCVSVSRALGERKMVLYLYWYDDSATKNALFSCQDAISLTQNSTVARKCIF